MPPKKKHRVLITNPHPIGGKPDIVVKGVVAKGYIIVPIEAGLFEVYMGNKYLGEAESDAQIRKLIERDGADAPVLIQNTNGGYEMYSYTRPKSNPKKRKKNAKKRKKATKRKTKKKSTKRKTSKKKMSPRKKKRVTKAKKKVKKAKKKVKSAKKKVKKAKKGLRKAKSSLSKAKRSKNPSKPTTNPRKKKRKSSKKKVSKAPRSKATLGDINAYVKRVTGSKF